MGQLRKNLEPTRAECMSVAESNDRTLLGVRFPTCERGMTREHLSEKFL